jgi:hypothetical protein
MAEVGRGWTVKMEAAVLAGDAGFRVGCPDLAAPRQGRRP